MGRRIIYIVSGISLILIVGILYFLGKQEKTSPISVQELEKVPIEETLFEGEVKNYWMGIYIGGEKAGYIFTQEKKISTGYEIKQRTQLELTMLGQPKKLVATTFVNTDKDFRLQNFDFFLHSEEQEFNLRGKRRGEKLEVSIRSPTINTDTILHIGKFAYLPVTLEAFVKEKQVKEKGSWTFKMFDPSVMQLADVTLRYLGSEKIEVHNKSYQTEAYEWTFGGATFRIWVDDNGILRETGPFQMEMIRETREMATTLPGVPMDILFKFAIPALGKSLPPSPKRVVMRLSNINPEILDLEFATQRVLEKGKDYVVIENTLPEIAENGFPYPDEVLTYLKPDPFVQSNHPRIKEISKKWVGNLSSRKEKAKVLVTKVYNFLEKSATVTIPTSLEVLNMRKGDCNEHTVLYAALARSQDIPTRIAVGLIYQEGYFFYHAWDAVYLGDKWVFVDPTYDEFPANPLHIMLKLGGIDKQAEVAPIVGNIKIEILEVG